MRIVADLHVHTKYARATSEQCDLEGFVKGAKTKGIDLLATGDFTHPRWLAELKAKLEPKGEGLYTYKDLRFILQSEVSLIYELNGKTKKMHHILYAPSLEIAEQISERFSKYGKIEEDGRPTLKLSSAGLIEELMQISKDAFLVCAHAWTPWFGVFGSKSGVDSIEEAFEDKAEEVFALETGLSSDPKMNWMLSSLDRFSLISNSDCHSLGNLGREANVFDLDEISFKSLKNAIKTRKGFSKTYEFYPEEGKYHYDGHRNCNVLLSPEEAERYNNICPVCKKKLTVGVLHRVYDLADRKYGFKPENSVPFKYIIPLRTVISSVLRKGIMTQAVEEEYSRLIQYFGNEFAVYEASDEQIRLATSPEIARTIIKANKGEIKWIPGYDGVFGKLVLDGRDFKGIKDRKQKTLGEF